MCRICRIIVPFCNQQAKAARKYLFKSASFKLTPNSAQIRRTSSDQEELCIELLIPGVKTDEEAEKAVKEIWNNSISGALKAFKHDDVVITLE